MTSRFIGTLLASIVTGLVTAAAAEEQKDLSTEQSKAIVIANFVGPAPDCSLTPTPQPLPGLREKPLSGLIGMQILVTDVAASGNCPTRKIPSLALFYMPKQGFVGTDFFLLEVNKGDNSFSTVRYRITVK
jgi:hypothetical protein